MNKQDKDIFDIFDEFISEFNGEELAKNISKGVEHLSENISDSIEESLNKRAKTTTNPKFSHYLSSTSRVEVVQEAIFNPEIYKNQFVGNYKVGYEESIKDIQNHFNQYSNDLDLFYKHIKGQIKQIQDHASNYKKSYVNGYIHGCEYVLKAILSSKKMMMDKILNEVL